MKLIVGLGNPGKKYADTRHNMGFLVVDALGEIPGARLLKPDTYMNNSGTAVKTEADYYKIEPKDIVVIHDDLDLEFGKILVKSGQRAAGHNGVQSIIDSFGGALEFTRVRVGIGRPPNPNIPVEDWVVSPWTAEEKEKLPAIIDEAVALTKKIFSDNL